MKKRYAVFFMVLLLFVAINLLAYSLRQPKKALTFGRFESLNNTEQLIDPQSSDQSTLEIKSSTSIANNISKEKIDSPFLQVDSNNNIENVCILPIYDIWYKELKKGMRWEDPTLGCDEDFRPWTKLVNSTWKIVKKGADCKARCFYGVGSSNSVLFDEWTPPGRVECEFLEVICGMNGVTEYGNIHTQIIPKSPTPLPTLFANPPSVYVIMIDSMDTGMARRFLPKFISHFQTKFQAVEFPYVNKVGENSCPNAHALWFGKTIKGGYRKVTWEAVKADWGYAEFCERYLDNETHLFKEFEQHGYATLHSENDIYMTMDSYPACKGFQHKFVHHFHRPFSVVHFSKGENATLKHLDGHLCRESYHAQFEWLEQAMKTYYGDRPLFSWIWESNLAHGSVDGVARFENYLVEFANRNSEMFNDAFVIFAGDHGLRIGAHVATALGTLEASNPYLAISVPKYLRDEKYGILKTLKENSGKLQTHFDTRATLLDILKYQPLSKFKDRGLIEIPKEKGHSLLRRQPDFPRTCATLPIPRQYCICQVEKYRITDEELNTRLGEKLLDHVHRKFERLNLTSLCHEYIIKKVDVIEYAYSKNRPTYKVSVTTNPYSLLEAMMSYSIETGNAIIDNVLRLDTYETRSECTLTLNLKEPTCNCKDSTILKWF